MASSMWPRGYKRLDEKKRRIEQKEKEEAERKRIEEEAGLVIQGGW